MTIVSYYYYLNVLLYIIYYIPYIIITLMDLTLQSQDIGELNEFLKNILPGVGLDTSATT